MHLSDTMRYEQINTPKFHPLKENIDKFTHYDGFGGDAGHRDAITSHSTRRNPGRMVRLKQKGRCECKLYCGCGSSCKNVRAFEICTKNNCINRGKCANNWCNPKNQHLHTCIPKQQGDIEGEGLYTFEPIPSGAVVGQYVGVVKEWSPQKKPPSSYCVQMSHNDKMYVIDAEAMGNNTRYLNHSCDPNCELVQRTVNGKETIWVKTVRAVPAKVFLTIKYHEEVSGFFAVCKCGAKNCCDRNS